METDNSSNLKSPKHDNSHYFSSWMNRGMMQNLISIIFSSYRRLRKIVLVIIIFYFLLAILSIWQTVHTIQLNCSRKLSGGFLLLSLISILRLLWFCATGKSQSQAATAIVRESRINDPEELKKMKMERKIIYRRWGHWCKVGIVLSLCQFASSSFLTYAAAIDLSFRNSNEGVNNCSIYGKFWTGIFVVLMCCFSWLLCLGQFLCGADVFAWRSLYSMHDYAWRAHYRELFNRNIREIMCCLGRTHYWDSMEDDDVDAVSSLLGDLMAYRAVGASHLEVLAGLALLREPSSKKIFEKKSKIPSFDVLKQASVLHSFAIAAYTGPLLDLGRNPFTFLCVWLFRQGVLAPWTLHKRPILEGDNYWRGHATAFLKYLNLSPELLLKGRVKQKNSQAVYFVVVFPAVRSVIICVRGTESPEDLIIDGLGRECALEEADLGCVQRSPGKNGEFFPAFGHAGVVFAARELAYQLDDMPMQGKINECENEGKRGYLSHLLNEKFHGYDLRIVGHSMGGAVASLTGMRLSLRFPNLHVYAYGCLPCIDYLTAEASTSIITSIVYNDEFSCRMSVASLMRLRASALTAVATQANTDLPMIHNLTHLLHSIPSNASRQTSALVNAGSTAVTTLGQILTNAISTAKSAASAVAKKQSFIGKINFTLRDSFLPSQPSSDVVDVDADVEGVTDQQQRDAITIDIPSVSAELLHGHQTNDDLPASISMQKKGEEERNAQTNREEMKKKKELIPFNSSSSSLPNSSSPFFSKHDNGYTDADFSSLADYSHAMGGKEFSEWRGESSVGKEGEEIRESVEEKEEEEAMPMRRRSIIKQKFLGNMPSFFAPLSPPTPLSSSRHHPSDAFKKEELEQFVSKEIVSQNDSAEKDKKEDSVPTERFASPARSIFAESTQVSRPRASKTSRMESNKSQRSVETSTSGIHVSKHDDYDGDDDNDDDNDDDIDDDIDDDDDGDDGFNFEGHDQFNSFRLYEEKFKKYNENIIHPYEVFVPGEVLLIIRDDGNIYDNNNNNNNNNYENNENDMNLDGIAPNSNMHMDGKENEDENKEGYGGRGGNGDGEKYQLWNFFKSNVGMRKKIKHRVMVIDRESLKDLIISPSMFLDHLPWRMSNALNEILDSISKESLMVNENEENHYTEIV